jgi:probable HAF family extracellular repeat protein
MIRLRCMRWLFAALPMAAVLSAAANAGEPRFTMQRLELGCDANNGYYCPATAINNKGWLTGTGFSRVPPRVRHTFLYKNGLLKSIARDRGESRGIDINDRGQIVVFDESHREALLYFRGTWKRLGSPASAFVYVSPQAINNAGDVVGRADTRDGRTVAFLYRGGRMIDLSRSPYFFNGPYIEPPIAINNRGDLVSVVTRGNEQTVGIYSEGRFTAIDTFVGQVDINQLRINDAKQVALHGTRYDSGATSTSVTRLYSGDAVVDLPPLRGDPYLGELALNNCGDVVGQGFTLRGYSAFLYRGGRTYDLNRRVAGGTGGWELLQAIDINDRGQIIVRAKRGPPGATRYGYLLLTPLPASALADGATAK